MVAEACIIWKCCRQNWITRSSWFHNLVLVTSSNPKEACTLAPSRKGWEYMRIFIMSVIYYLLQCNSILLDSNVKKKVEGVAFIWRLYQKRFSGALQ